MESIKQYPANIYYNHNRASAADDSQSNQKTKDYVLMGMALCLPAFLGSALFMTILSMTILYKWIPEVLLIALVLAVSFGSLFGTLKYFFRLDTAQQNKR